MGSLPNGSLQPDSGANRHTRRDHRATGKENGAEWLPTHAITFDNAHVPLTNLLGEEGQGLQQTLATLTKGRVSIGALALGLAQGSL